MRVRGKPVSTGVLGREGELLVAVLRSCFPAGGPSIYSERCINPKLNGSTSCALLFLHLRVCFWEHNSPETLGGFTEHPCSTRPLTGRCGGSFS